MACNLDTTDPGLSVAVQVEQVSSTDILHYPLDFFNEMEHCCKRASFSMSSFLECSFDFEVGVGRCKKNEHK